MPLLETKGAGSAQGFGLSLGSAEAVYIEDVFSTYLYTGTGLAVTQRIASGLDLATKGGMVWLKNRTETTAHQIYDTARGERKYIRSNTTDAEFDSGSNQVQYETSGWDAFQYTNELNKVMASWTFRKQPKFFDVVTYTGNGDSGLSISHNLGSVPGCIIWKRTDATSPWGVWHIASNITSSRTGASLNATDGFAYTTNGTTRFTSTYFQPSFISAHTGEDGNTNGGTYVAYLFAHDAGGFGLTGTDNVISCGSFTTGSGGKMSAPVNLGYEAQWLLVKNINASENWTLFDTMRGMSNTGYAALNPNTSGAEYTGTSAISATATGFDTPNASGPFANSTTYIYIAIRRGPMKVPTSGTSVFSPVARTGTGAAAQITGTAFPPDLIIGKPRTGYSVGTAQFTRLLGTTKYLAPSWTDAEIADSTMVTSFNMDGVSLGADTTQRYFNGSSGTYANWLFRRAPGFFDVVCYTGTGSATTFSHNLGVVPEMMIVKSRNAAGNWTVYHSGAGNTKYLRVNSDVAVITDPVWNNTTPTATVFSVGSGAPTNSTDTFVAYLFATCAGVSKVGSYTGNGSNQTINCGFTGGARFVMIKRTDSTGDWYVWDTARGIIAGNDPYLLLNSTAAEVTSTDYVDTYSAGFEISSTAPAAINASAGTFIFLAIA